MSSEAVDYDAQVAAVREAFEREFGRFARFRGEAGAEGLSLAEAEAALRELGFVLAVADRVASDLDELAADHAGLLDALINAPPPSARAALLDHLRRGESRAMAVTA